MLKLLRNIWLGVSLILLASGLLLLSDLDRRRGAKKSSKALPRLAVMQWASTDLLDQIVKGFIEGLRQQGFEHGRTADIRFLNASGDNSTGNVMARDLVGGSYDLVLTASTLALQAVAKANTPGRVIHVFGGVTDPYGAGVGITGPKPDQHPGHLVGVGTFQPVDRAIRIARKMNPKLRKIGVAWSPGESNSEACVLKARSTCKDLGIELIEANVGNTSEVPEAIRSILARGSEAVWVGGDTVAISAISAIVSSARALKVPVFTNDPNDTADKGVIFGVGASYHKVGVAVGEIAGKILNGTSPKSFGVENLVPEVLTVNETLVKEFEGWSIPEEIHAQAMASTNVTGTAAVPSSQVPARCWEIRIARYNDAQFSADTWRGIMDGFKKQGLQEGRDFNVRCLNAQGDITTMTSIMTAIRAERPDLVMTISTPALQAALRQIGDLPIVFACVADAVRAGAGKSDSDHLPNVTGITTLSPFASMAQLIRKSVPNVRAVGTLFSPGEVNAALNRQWFAEALEREGLKLVSVPVNNSAETAEATSVMLRSDIQIVCQIMDNTARPGFAQIAKRAKDACLPFFCFDSSGIREGATLGLGRDYYYSGAEASEVAVQVLRGAKPAQIPITNTRTEIIVVNQDLIRKYGIVLSPEYLKKAQIVKREE
ncbi:MAG: ABC transporter substrate-binding protein [Kiritimatiellae bacterium]|nr:ABC transporter substrate-binding protein [Kiritimatiellia bacterium]MDD5522295.1 ABC transporter substrate-binding protein [Kiritimatiellia bacterium]